MTEKNKIQRQITKRFLEAIDRLPDTQISIAERVGMTTQNIARLRVDPNKYVTLQACYKLCKEFGYNPTWLLMGRGKMINVNPIK